MPAWLYTKLNVNESFNNIVWSRVLKSTFVGLKTLEIVVRDAVISFNDGNVDRLRVLRRRTWCDIFRETHDSGSSKVGRNPNERVVQSC